MSCHIKVTALTSCKQQTNLDFTQSRNKCSIDDLHNYILFTEHNSLMIFTVHALFLADSQICQEVSKRSSVTRILPFQVDFLLKSLLSGFNHKQNASVKLRQRYQMNFNSEGYSKYFFRGFLGSKLEKIGQFFQVSIHIHPCHPKRQPTGNSFSAFK